MTLKQKLDSTKFTARILIKLFNLTLIITENRGNLIFLNDLTMEVAHIPIRHIEKVNRTIK